MVIDTSLFIEHIRAKDKSNTRLRQLPNLDAVYVSVVTIYELYVGANSVEKERDLAVLLNEYTVLPMNREVVIRAAEIYKTLKIRGSLIGTNDIYIAATCLENDLPINTINVKDFIRIEGLKLA